MEHEIAKAYNMSIVYLDELKEENKEIKEKKINDYMVIVMTEKRFELKQFHYQDLTMILFDNLEHKELHLNLYSLIDLLNNVAQKEYDFIRTKNNIKKDMEELIDKLSRW